MASRTILTHFWRLQRALLSSSEDIKLLKSRHSVVLVTHCRNFAGTNVINGRRGIVPEGQDYGGYDEDKHEEYEKDAEDHQKKIKIYKKILSTAAFAGVLGAAVYGKYRHRKEFEENIKHCYFLPVDDNFRGSYRSFCKVIEEGKTPSVFPVQIVSDGTLKDIKKLDLRADDVVVASFPKSGTTWVQEIVFLIQNGMDFKKAKSSVMETRSPFLEYPYPGLKAIRKDTSRVLKTHLPYDYLPDNLVDKGTKIIYVTRNPKDVVVSYYHFSKMFAMLNYTGTFSDFVRSFMNDNLPYCPYFDHIQSYHACRDDSNMLIVKYEDLSKDPYTVILRIANFLQKPLSDQDIQNLMEHTRFSSMAQNSSVNYQHWDDLGLRNRAQAKFMRKGEVGDWKNYFDDESSRKFDSWILKRKNSEISFDYEV